MLALEQNFIGRLDPGSAIFLEFFEAACGKPEPELLVRIFYKFKPDSGESDTLIFRFGAIPAQREDGSIPLGAFREFLLTKIYDWDRNLGVNGSLEEHCRKDFND